MSRRTRPSVFLHIGAMKTGTTFLQQVMIQNREALGASGYLFPGAAWVDQVRAAHDVLGHHRERGVRHRASGSWDAIAAEMLAWEGAASVLSVEFLSFAAAPAARRVVESFGDADVHLVLTVRDTGVVLPGLWQTHCANGGTASWPGFARSARFGSGAGPLARPLGQGARLFRRALDVPRMLDVWKSAVPAGQLHVVTVPPQGSPPQLLWERFASVLGVDPAVAARPAQGHNPSLGYASADLMRRLNAELGRLPRNRYNPTLKHVLAERVLAARTEGEHRARLDAAGEEFAVRWNRRTREALEASTAHLTGDLADLPITEPPAPAPPVDEPSREDLLDAAEHAVRGMEGVVVRRSRRLARRQGLETEAAEPAAGAPRRAVWEAAADPVAAAVEDLADLTRLAITLHERLNRPVG